jgi:ribosome-binding protein aMBF1 (putative translation factor)
MTLGDCIHLARRAHDLSQSELAALVGLSTNAVHKIEVGDTADPHFSHVRKLAEVLHLSLDAMTADLTYPAARRRQTPRAPYA